MLSFGNKSFLLAHDQNEDILGLMGWQVENLITRCDELVLKPPCRSNRLLTRS